ncbi:TPA: response regulator [Candidatus Micrarchaeota archaeon]|nr:response regulator [Candidatus Micrarchaeota archaeon]
MPTIETTKKILIIDDDESLGSLLKQKLNKSGMSAVCASDGGQGLDAMNKERFDCILLDLKMPIKDGFAVLKSRNATLNAETPVYVLTSLDEDKCKQALELGAKGVMNKIEISPAQVADRVAKEVA